MAKPSEMWKKNRAHTEEVTKVLTDMGNMNRFGEIIGWLGKSQHIAMQKLGHSALDFANCRCKNNDN